MNDAIKLGLVWVCESVKSHFRLITSIYLFFLLFFWFLFVGQIFKAAILQFKTDLVKLWPFVLMVSYDIQI